MPLTAYMPKDLESYQRHPRSIEFSPEIEEGVYCYVQDVDGTIWVAPDGNHIHPRILGAARPVVAAGELVLEQNGHVVGINNASGTFQCDKDCLFSALGGLWRQGARFDRRAVTEY